uniref:Uncharacterized protein n=1 Tax=Tetranychus urticae TaxID=32264 RepID=T1K892_TETUR
MLVIDVLLRNGMENVWKHNSVVSLTELCCRSIVSCTTVYGVEHHTMKSARSPHSPSHKYKDLNSTIRRKAKAFFTCDTNEFPSLNRLHYNPHIHHPFRSYSSANVDYHQKNCVIS